MEDKNLDNQNKKEKNKSLFTDNTKLYFKIKYSMAPAKLILSFVIPFLYIAGLVVTFILFYRLFIVLVIYGLIFLFVFSVKSTAVFSKKQEKSREYLIKHLSELKEYDAKVAMITSTFAMQIKNYFALIGRVIYCEVNGKYIKRNIPFNYQQNESIKIYMHDSITNYFLTEQEYLHPDMTLEEYINYENQNNVDKKTTDDQNSAEDVNLDNETDIQDINYENDVYNPNNHDETKKYYKTQLSISPFRMILRFIIAISFMISLLYTFFTGFLVNNLNSFLILFFGGIVILIILDAIVKGIDKGVQKGRERRLIKNIDKLKEYDAIVRLITARVSVQIAGKKPKTFGNHRII